MDDAAVQALGPNEPEGAAAYVCFREVCNSG